MESAGGYQPPPGTGVFRPGDDPDFSPGDHCRGWDRAVQAALDKIGRSPGRYTMAVSFSAVVEIENPGNIIEYIAKFT